MNKDIDPNSDVKYKRILEAIDNLDNIIDKIDCFEDNLKFLEPNERDEYRRVFYRRFVEKNIDVFDNDVLEMMINYILALCESFDDNQVRYSVVMDTCILYAIKMFYKGVLSVSKKYFREAISYAENRLDFARHEFFDSLNCAYSWLGVINYQERNFKEAYKYFDIAIKNYDSVKDDPDYFVKEKDVISVCISYINMIKVD